MEFKVQERNNIIWTYILFIIWPAVTFILALRNLNIKQYRVIFIVFYAFFGFVLVYGSAADSYRHALSFADISKKPFDDFFSIVSGLYSEEGQKPDFVMDLISFIVSRFTDQASFFFSVLSAIVGVLVIKNVSVFYKLYNDNKNATCLFFIFFFIAIMPPARILSFRHYTALLIYVYCIYKYFSERKNIYMFFLCLTAFFHFSYLMIIPLFFLHKFIGNKNIIYYTLIVLSFMFADQTSSFLREYGVGLDIGVETAVKGYTNTKYLERTEGFQQSGNIFINNYIRWTGLFMLFTLIWHKLKYKKFDSVSENIYSFSLLFFTFVNITVPMASISNRFTVVYHSICCVFYIHLYGKNNYKVNPVFKYTSYGFLILNFMILLRITFEYSNFLLLTPFFPISLFAESDYTILNFIK